MSRALEGVRVVDLTHGAFAYAPYLLAGEGAEIVSVGAARARDYSRWDALGPSAGERRRDLERAEVLSELGRLVRSADVVVETFPPGHLHDHGLDWRDLESECPRLVWASITPFGESGPRRDWKSANLLAYAFSGVLPAIGDPDRPPVVPGGPI
ncbi:MAG: CoA transferase, partial [Candidatus Binatia bacterium]